MSKKARKKSSEKRASMKRARKDQMQKQYQAWADAGSNKKSKRYALSNQKKRCIKTIKHPHGTCGNHGCKKCNVFDAPVWRRANKPYATSLEKLRFYGTQMVKCISSPLVRLAQLDAKFGSNKGATRERNKLQALMNASETVDNVAA